MATDNPATPTGTLIRNTQRHPAYSVSNPPSTHPDAPPPAAAAVQIPTARRRAAPGSVTALSRASAAGVSRAAASPCSTRAAISTQPAGARPQASDAAVNPARPIVKARRAPTRSAARPPATRNPPKASTYAVTTHCRSSAPKPSSRPRAGRALVTTVTSSTMTNWATQTSAIAKAQRLPAKGFTTVTLCPRSDSVQDR